MRLPDWQVHFERFIEEHRTLPFAWGKHDCCLFAANSVFAITGIDYAKDFRDTYNSTSSAARVIAKFGDLESVAIHLLGYPPVSVMYADIGDVILTNQDGRDLLAVCNGSTMLAPGEHGLVTLETYTGLRTWKI